MRIALLLVWLAGIASAEDLARAASELRSPWTAVREAAVRTLGDAGKPALPHVLPLLTDPDARVRRLAASAAAATRRPEAQAALLIRLVEESDPRVFEHVARSLARFGRAAWEVISQRAALPSATDRDRRARDVFLWEYVIKTIHVTLEENTNSGGEFKGFFDGQFHRLAAIGPEAADVLTEMMGDGDRFPVTIRQIAVRALAEVGDARHMEALRAFHKRLDDQLDREDPMRFEPNPDKTLRSYARYVLARHGIIEPSRANIERWRRARDHYLGRQKYTYAAQYQWAIAYEYHQVRDFPTAIAAYQRYLQDYPPERLEFMNVRHLAWYNLACIESLRASRLDGVHKVAAQKRAIGYLARAFDENYTDFGWIMMDRDLIAIQSTDSFKALVEKARASYSATAPLEPTKKGSGKGKDL